MKKLIFLILLLPSLCLAGSIQDMHKAVIARMNVSAAAGTDFTANANCRGAWAFADAMTDASGEGNTLDDTNKGSASYYTATYPTDYSTGKGYGVFDGTDDFIFVALADLSANFPGKAAKAAMSVSTWFKRGATSNDTQALMGVWDMDDFQDRSWLLRLSWDAGGEALLGFSTGTTGLSEYEVLAGSNLNDTDWHHVVVVFDESATGAEVAFYFDGGEAVTYANANATVQASDTDGFSIGKMYDDTDGDWYNGTVYQVMVFDDALSGAEAAAIYADGMTGLD